MRKPPVKTIIRLLAAQQREAERLKARYKANGARMDRLIKLGATRLESIALPDGRLVVIEDQFAESNTAFKSAAVARYVVKPYRPDKSALPSRPRRASTSDQPKAEAIGQI